MKKTSISSRTDPMRLVCSTLRDGWQGDIQEHETIPVVDHVNAAVEYAKTAGDFGIWMMDAGVPIAKNPSCAQIVTEIARSYSDDDRMGILGFTLADKQCIDKTVEATKHAARGGVAILVSPSQHHMPKYIKGKVAGIDLNRVYAQKKEEFARAVEHAATLKKQGLITDIHVYIEDATRTTRERLKEIVTMMIQAGATSICPCDTMGEMNMYEYAKLFQNLRSDISMRMRRQVRFTAHCHDDYHLAVANSVYVAHAGLVDGVEVTFGGGGPGEGPGNADGNAVAYQILRENSAVPLPARFKNTGLHPELLYKLNQNAGAFLGRMIPPKAPIVGESTRKTAAPIHVDGAEKSGAYMAQNPGTDVFSMYTHDYSEYGVPEGRKYDVDKYVSPKSLKSALAERGINTKGMDVDHAHSNAVAIAMDTNRRLPDDLLEALAWDACFPANKRPVQVDLQTIQTSMSSGTGKKQHQVKVPITYKGATQIFTGTGKGQTSAFVDAMEQFTQNNFEFSLDITAYRPLAETEGKKKHHKRDARVFTPMLVAVDGQTYRTFGFDEAQEWSSFKAVLFAVNRRIMENNEKEK